MLALHHQSLRRLLYFHHVVEAGTLRSAAEHLQVSTPVVSAALADLEEELQVTLLVRSTRRLELTDAGRSVFEHASQMLTHAHEALQISTLNQDIHGTVAITVPSEVAIDWLPPVLAAFSEAYPNIEPIISVSDEVQELQNSRYDLALRTKFFLRPGASEDMPEQTVALVPLVLVTRDPGPATLQPDGVTVKTTAPFLGSEYLHTHGIDAVHRDSGRGVKFKMSRGFTLSSRQTALELCRKGLGIAHLTAPTVQEHLDNGTLRDAAPAYDFGAIAVFTVFRDSYPSPATRAFASVAMRR